MSLSNDINTTSTALSDIKDAIIAKGVTPSGNITTYATAISQISGTTPTGTISITDNGTYDVTDYASADVNVSGGGGYSELPSYQVSNGVASRRSDDLTGNEFSGITSVGNYGLSHAFENCNDLTGALDLSSLTSIGDNGLSYAFFACNNLTSVDLSSLTTVGNYGLQHAFEYCEPLEDAFDLSSLTTVGNYGLQYAFAEVGGSTSVNLSSLTSVGNSGLNGAFANCGSLSGTIDLSSLTTVGSEGLAGAFTSTFIEHIYFRALTSDSFADDTVFDGMLDSVRDATVHFPSNLQSVIGSWSSVTSGFDGTNTTVLFDLTATE